MTDEPDDTLETFDFAYRVGALGACRRILIRVEKLQAPTLEAVKKIIRGVASEEKTDG